MCKLQSLWFIQVNELTFLLNKVFNGEAIKLFPIKERLKLIITRTWIGLTVMSGESMTKLDWGLPLLAEDESWRDPSSSAGQSEGERILENEYNWQFYGPDNWIGFNWSHIWATRNFRKSFVSLKMQMAICRPDWFWTLITKKACIR